ncbi:hypothetical protein D3C75_1203330 [compost metagenome]
MHSIPASPGDTVFFGSTICAYPRTMSWVKSVKDFVMRKFDSPQRGLHIACDGLGRRNAPMTQPLSMLDDANPLVEHWVSMKV